MIMDQYDARRYLNEFLNLNAHYVPTTPGKILLLSKFDNALIGELNRTEPIDIDTYSIRMKLIRTGSGHFQYILSHKRLEDIYFQVI